MHEFPQYIICKSCWYLHGFRRENMNRFFLGYTWISALHDLFSSRLESLTYSLSYSGESFYNVYGVFMDFLFWTMLLDGPLWILYSHSSSSEDKSFWTGWSSDFDSSINNNLSTFLAFYEQILYALHLHRKALTVILLFCHERSKD